MKSDAKKKEDGFQIVHPNAAGIDIASQMHYVAVPPDRDEMPVRKFGSFTVDLHEIAKWLKLCNVDTVAMESTGIYWVQLYLILEEYGFEVYLVNARHIKNVTGRKSDVLDCQWILQLHTYGLLNRSFQPESITRELRSYMRQRKNLTESYAAEIQHMQKALDQMNIKLHNVIADITGKSGQAIVNAVLLGERDPYRLAELADKRIKASKEDLIKSLEGNWRDEHLFELKQAYELYLIFKDKILECDKQIEKVLQKLKPEDGSPSNEKKEERKIYSKNRFRFNASEYLKGIVGVDLTKIFGISELIATEIISETGLDMSKWPTKKHFTSWLNLVPNNRISGGKLLKPKKVKKKNKAGQAFLMAAFALQRSEHWLGEFYRRIKAKNGPAVATKATARKLALIFYEMIKCKMEFTPISVEIYNAHFKEKRVKYIINQALKYGLNITSA
jgi:transposase